MSNKYMWKSISIVTYQEKHDVEQRLREVEIMSSSLTLKKCSER